MLDGAKFETAILTLLRMQEPENFAQVRGVSEGLENRLAAAVREANSMDDLYTRLKTKRYPHARLRRLVLDAALQLRQNCNAALPVCVGRTKNSAAAFKTGNASGRHSSGRPSAQQRRS